MQRIPARAARAAAALALAAVACGRPAPAGPATKVHIDFGETLHYVRTSEVEGREPRRLELTVHPGVTYGWRGSDSIVLVTEGGDERGLEVEVASPTGLSLRGLPVAFDDDVLTIGTTSYGPLPGSVKIDVREDGVFVDGERRGGLGGAEPGDE